MHILEVSLRNRINEIFKINYGEDWANHSNFQSILTFESLSNLEAALCRASQNKTENVISELSFDFWSNLFRPEYDRYFWQKNMKFLISNNLVTRKVFQKMIKEINKFRNRIAHHEPIHYLNISELHSQLIEVIGWISKETGHWVKHHSTVNEILRTSPSIEGGVRPHFGERCDNDFILIHENSLLSEIPKKRFILVQNDFGLIESIIEYKDIFIFIMRLIDNDGKSIVIDLSQYTFKNVCEKLELKVNYHECGYEESLNKANLIFKKSKNEFIIVKKINEIIGVISKSHRRY